MKNYVTSIIISGVVLLLFPFLGLPEFWEYLFVIIPAAVILFAALNVFRSLPRAEETSEEEKLQAYIQNLQNRFNEAGQPGKPDVSELVRKQVDTVNTTKENISVEPSKNDNS